MRGEHRASSSGVIRSPGPSPHARGTPPEAEARRTGGRSIPACAGNTSTARSPAPCHPVHPRMRGEHGFTSAPDRARTGPSPHARGTPHPPRGHPHERRSIPACAGNTAGSTIPPGSTTVHPRMRGEHGWPRPRPERATGPSPHARGTLRSAEDRALQPRSIPACAGNTSVSWTPTHVSAVHPRMRGEHWRRANSACPFTGPSPHARGTLSQHHADRPLHRSIPACAGNTRSRARNSAIKAVHPRMRGEHTPVVHVAGVGTGPSPHARGTLLRCARRLRKARSIPACAGNTFSAARRSNAITVHPRMRGEHGVAFRMLRGVGGPSPHARGTRRRVRAGLAQARSIPACAGNTSAPAGSFSTKAVHPRMRGEHRIRARGDTPNAGPSPHARGTPFRQGVLAVVVRSIPACAGNTPGCAPSQTSDPVHPRMRGEHTGWRRRAAASSAVHPRMRGEHWPASVRIWPRTGPSPHARGTRCGGHHRARHGRSIPACAGNTVLSLAMSLLGAVHPRMRGEHRT